eukprot:TRINITY_DN4500_c0_g1_i12.p2 TRINITY_DN4500_c0_g1~~TRINITY_DN4500_c0_g1_i12.p2  ORF type:complete len:213 (-),score=39.86 TRINITY_DN4500_c0_g1_i12:96-734(-)
MSRKDFQISRGLLEVIFSQIQFLSLTLLLEEYLVFQTGLMHITNLSSTMAPQTIVSTYAISPSSHCLQTSKAELCEILIFLSFIQPKKFSTDEKQRNLSFEDRGEDLFGPKETTKSFPGTKFLSKETRRLHQGFMPNETDYHPVMVTDSNDELFKLILEHKTDAREQLMSRFDQKVECKSEEENMNEDQNDEDIGHDVGTNILSQILESDDF